MPRGRPLTDAEIGQILKMTKNQSNRQVAIQMGISRKTVIRVLNRGRDE